MFDILNQKKSLSSILYINFYACGVKVIGGILLKIFDLFKDHMGIDIRKPEHEPKPTTDFTVWVSLVFVAVMIFVITRPITRPIPTLSPMVSFYMPTCVGMSIDPRAPVEGVHITVDFDDTLLWNGKAMSQIEFERDLTKLGTNHGYVFFVLNINPLASNKMALEVLQKMKAHQREHVVLSNDFTL